MMELPAHKSNKKLKEVITMKRLIKNKAFLIGTGVLLTAVIITVAAFRVSGTQGDPGDLYLADIPSDTVPGNIPDNPASNDVPAISDAGEVPGPVHMGNSDDPADGGQDERTGRPDENLSQPPASISQPSSEPSSPGNSKPPVSNPSIPSSPPNTAAPTVSSPVDIHKLEDGFGDWTPPPPGQGIELISEGYENIPVNIDAWVETLQPDIAAVAGSNLLMAGYDSLYPNAIPVSQMTENAVKRFAETGDVVLKPDVYGLPGLVGYYSARITASGTNAREAGDYIAGYMMADAEFNRMADTVFSIYKDGWIAVYQRDGYFHVLFAVVDKGYSGIVIG
jgi:hypothetical protein